MADPPAALLAAAALLDEVLDREVEALARPGGAGLAGFTEAKAVCLLELTRLARQVPEDRLDPAMRAALAATRRRLERNLAVLGSHRDAARQVCGTIAAALRDADSDGTYASHGPRGGGGR